jgi:hypothetical protein
MHGLIKRVVEVDHHALVIAFRNEKKPAGRAGLRASTKPSMDQCW